MPPVPSVPRRPASVATAAVLAGAVSVAACGGAVDSPAPPGGTSSGGTSSGVTPTEVTPSPAGGPFPITVRRSGGVAGFNDTVVVQRDGGAEVRTKAGSSTCTVDADTLAALADLAVQATASSGPSASHPDALTVTVSTAEGTAVLAEGNLPGTAPAVGKLLEDVGRLAADRAVCR